MLWLKLNITECLDGRIAAAALVVVAIVLLSRKLFAKLNKSMKQRTNDRTTEGAKKIWKKIPLNTYTFLNNKIFTVTHNLLSVWKVDAIWTEPKKHWKRNKSEKYNLKTFLCPFVPFAWKWAEATSSNWKLKIKHGTRWHRRNMEIFYARTNTPNFNWSNIW